MVSRIVSGGALAALAGAAMLAVSSGPSSAFTLNLPSLEGPAGAAGIQQVYFYGCDHPDYHPYYHPY